MCGVGLLHDGLALLPEHFCLSGVHGRWCKQTDAGVMMVRVVPGEESLRPLASIRQGTKAARVARGIFEGLERRLGKRIVIGHPGPAGA